MAGMFRVNTREIRLFERALGVLRKRGVPFAVRDAINQQAFTAQKLWRRKMSAEFILRNRWTQGSVRVKKAHTLKISRMESRVGSLADYMKESELGGVTRGGKTSIPSSSAAGQAKGSKPRMRLVRGANKIAAITLKRPRHRNRKVRNLISIRRARKTSKRHVFLELSSSRGIFKVGGGKKNPTIRMHWDLSGKGVRTPATPTLGPTVLRVKRRSERFYELAFKKQVRRIFRR